MNSRTGRHAPRSKNGCSTCRIRKIKCDEQRPTCSKCSQARIKCEWDIPIPPRRQAANYSAKRKDNIQGPRPVLPEPAKESPRRNEEIDTDDGRLTAANADPPSSLVLRNFNDMIVLPPILSVENIEMSNSLILNPQDLRAFQYIPESLMVLRFGKPWRWSMLSYLHSKIAPRDCGVMSAFIAVASMELRFRDLVQFTGGTITSTSLEHAAHLRRSAAKYFNLAINNLRSLLDRVSRTEPTSDEIESLFSMWFLILHCELYDPELIRASQIHLNGIRSFIASYLRNDDGLRHRSLPPASQQLLLFITYLDVNLALGNSNGGQLCLDLLSIPRESPFSYDRIWEAARVCLPKLWGSEYPAEEILDDVENYRGLSFLQSCQKLKLSIWQVAIAAGTGKAVNDSRNRLWTRIEDIGEEFCDLLILGKVTPNSGGRRVMWTIYHGCLDYYAVKVLFSCLDKNETSPGWLERTLADLLAVAHKALGEDPQQLYRMSWSLAVALLKVQDPIHRDWIQAQLRNARVLLSDIGLPHRLLDAGSPPENVVLEYSSSNAIEEIG